MGAEWTPAAIPFPPSLPSRCAMPSPASVLFPTRLLLRGVVLFAFLIIPISLGADLGNYVVLQVPGCGSTTAWGVNDRGDVVDRKSTRLNSSHLVISYAVFCLKKNKSRS